MQGKAKIGAVFALAIFTIVWIFSQVESGSASVNPVIRIQKISGKVLKSQDPKAQLKEVTLAISGMV